jgi:hypothetical protein
MRSYKDFIQPFLDGPDGKSGRLSVLIKRTDVPDIMRPPDIPGDTELSELTRHYGIPMSHNANAIDSFRGR